MVHSLCYWIKRFSVFLILCKMKKYDNMWHMSLSLLSANILTEMTLTTNHKWRLRRTPDELFFRAHVRIKKNRTDLYIPHKYIYTHTYIRIPPTYASESYSQKERWMSPFSAAYTQSRLSVICCRGRIGLPTFKTTTEFVSVGMKVRKCEWNFCVEYHTTDRKMQWSLNACSSLRHNFRSKHFLLW
jgi:hypothetical protein